MSSTILRFILKRVAKSLVKKGAERLIEEATGRDIPDAADAIRVIQDILGKDPREAEPEEVERAAEQALSRGRISQRQLEQVEETIMVDFNTFMSIGLEQCGSDRQTFADLVDVWNEQKELIRGMNAAELRRNLNCP